MKKNNKKSDRFLWTALLILSLIMSGLSANAKAVESQGVNISSTTLMYALDEVNVRDNPSTDGKILGKLQPGDTIFAMELTEEGWYRVAYGDEKGYIREDFLAVYGMEGDWQTPALEELEQSLEEEAVLYEDEPATKEETSQVQEEEAPKKEKKNIAPIIIIILVLIVIIAYSAVQILRERKQVGEEEEESGGEETDLED